MHQNIAEVRLESQKEIDDRCHCWSSLVVKELVDSHFDLHLAADFDNFGAVHAGKRHEF